MTASMILRKKVQTMTNLDDKPEVRIVGTPDYMAPEMLEGKGLDQPTIDYWALGVIFFELIVGIPPFNASSIEEIFQNIKANKIPWEDLVGEDGEEAVTEDAKSLITELLTSDPTKRLGYDSVETIKSHKFFKGSLG